MRSIASTVGRSFPTTNCSINWDFNYSIQKTRTGAFIGPGFGLHENFLGLLPEPTELLLGAADGHMEGLMMVQGKHAHKAFAVDLLFFVAHQHLKGLHHGQGHEIPYLPKGCHLNIKLPHEIASLCTNRIFSVIINTQGLL